LCEKQKESNESTAYKVVFLFFAMAAPLRHPCPFSVIPAKAGIQKNPNPNIQPFVLKAKNGFLPLDARLRGHDEGNAGMTKGT
jgi:hypothetical protein